MRLHKRHLFPEVGGILKECANCGLTPAEGMAECQAPGKYLEEVASEIAPMTEADDRNAWKVGDKIVNLPPPALAELANMIGVSTASLRQKQQTAEFYPDDMREQLRGPDGDMMLRWSYWHLASQKARRFDCDVLWALAALVEAHDKGTNIPNFKRALTERATGKPVSPHYADVLQRIGYDLRTILKDCKRVPDEVRTWSEKQMAWLKKEAYF